MNLQIPPLIAVLIFPGGLTLIAVGLLYEWISRKLVAQYQNRIGPRWFQPLADVIKQLAKEEIAPEGADPFLFRLLPVVGLAAVMTAALYVPMFGLGACFRLPWRFDCGALPVERDDDGVGPGWCQHA